MSLISTLNDEGARREAFVRAGAADPSIGSRERDWAENGWPAETVLQRLQDGAKHGRGAPGWSSVRSPGGEMHLSMELPGPTGFIHVALDPERGQAAFKSAGMLFGPESLEKAAEALARHSHQAGERLRSSDSASLRKGLWQGEAPEALAQMSAGLARFHPAPGQDASEAWEKAFESVDAASQAAPDPFAAMERAKSHYLGSSEKDMAALMEREAKAGPNARVAGEPARLVALGARGAQLRAAMPLKEDGSVDEQTPIVAVFGSEGDSGFKAKGAPLRFYNAEAFARFASSAQSAELGAFPAPRLDEDARSRLAARREALGSPLAPSAPQGPKA